MKVLIVGNNIFSNTISSGITQKMLFSAFAEADISVIDFININREFRIGMQNASDITSAVSKDDNLSNKILNYLKFHLRPLWSSFNRHRIEHIYGDIDNFKPTLIYSMLGNLPAIKALLDLNNRYPDMKICLHFMDDWPSYPYPGSFFQFFNRWVTKYYLLKLLKKTDRVLCISRDMCQEFSSRYGIEASSHFMNCVGDEWFQEGNMEVSSSPINISYFGGLHLSRDKTLKLFCEAIATIKYDSKININIYTSTKSKVTDSIASQYCFVKFHDSISHSKMHAAVGDSQILLLLEGFDKSSYQYSKYSLSTKIPEYLAAGKMIVAIGSPYNGSIRFLSQLNIGLVFNDPNQLYADQVLSKLSEWTVQSSSEMKLFARNNFHVLKQSELFHQTLINV